MEYIMFGIIVIYSVIIILLLKKGIYWKMEYNELKTKFWFERQRKNSLPEKNRKLVEKCTEQDI